MDTQLCDEAIGASVVGHEADVDIDDSGNHPLRCGGGRDERRGGRKSEHTRGRRRSVDDHPTMPTQREVAAFLDDHDLHADPAYRALDLASEVGEVAKECAESTSYGTDPEAVTVATDELGDALFALLALADELDIDAGAALDESLGKYRRRVADTGSGS